MAGLPLSAAKEKFIAMVSLILSHTIRFNLLVRYHKRITSHPINSFSAQYRVREE
jgi:hypothetical protein